MAKIISLRQGKTGRCVEIPCTKALTRMLNGIDRNAAVILHYEDAAAL